MQIQLNENNYITGYATVGGFPDGIEVDDNLLELLEDNKIGFYKYVNNQIIFDEKLYQQHEQEVLKDSIRDNRSADCFPVINRGLLWYETLSSNQKGQLNDWYKSWLEAPDTLTMPDQLDFIK